MPKDKSIKKVMVIGSGPIVIGQAAEFDYAGTQACRTLKSEGLYVILVNSNPATIMTDRDMADEIYTEPLCADTVKRLIELTKPDSLLAGLGGQTALTIAMQLHHDGFLQSHGVRLIGTNADAIDKSEDRQLFKDTMQAINQPVIPSDIATTTEQALQIAGKIGYPVIVRPAFTLGGAGGGVADCPEKLTEVAANGLLLSPITQILVEKYIFGYKEIEFEVMRDRKGNVITVCSMENIDPVGIHTGDSVVVAPALTLSDKEYQMLRSASLDIITALGIEGGCNCQFALSPDSFDYFVIEVNPRVSRSSALASKATGYPIAKVSTRIALGYTLDEIKNAVTGKTCACFEPALDYVVVKIPKWPFDKFITGSHILGTQMKATGEAMAIGQSFEEALMKAVRGAEISADTLSLPGFDDPRARLGVADDKRLFCIFAALKSGVSPDEISKITRIDRFFIDRMNNLVKYEAELAEGSLSEAQYLRGKKYGYTDAALKRISGCEIKNPLLPSYKTVDTCAGEFEAATPYFYACYDAECESRAVVRSGKPRVIVLGSGPIRIGQGIEFDYSSVHCANTLRRLGREVIFINNNPETVSTDFDISDRLYFEPLTAEDVAGVIAAEQPEGVVVAFGGQTAIKLVKYLSQAGIPILGTSAEGIDLAEDRERFDALLEQFGIRRPCGRTATDIPGALEAAQSVGYPVLLRPSYVIGGQNMIIAYNPDDVRRYMKNILDGGIENPVLVDKYLAGTELEVDVISDGEDVYIPGIMEHVERAGIHSGDSIAVYPAQTLTDRMIARVEDCSVKLAKSLGTRGLVNIQYLVHQGELYVIEVNPRASRTVPYISKATGVSMIDIATRVMLGEKLRDMGYGSGICPPPPYVAVKVPVFSFEKLGDVNSALGPQMKSTGEVLGIARTKNEALFKGLVSAGFKLDFDHSRKIGALLTVSDADKLEIVNLAKKLDDLGIDIYATPGTAQAVSALGIDVITVNRPCVDGQMQKLLDDGKIDFVLYTGVADEHTLADFIAIHRRTLLLGIACLTSVDTAEALADIIASGYNLGNTEPVDLNHMRKSRTALKFLRMQGCSNDYIYVDNRDAVVACPQSLAITACDRHRGIGGDGLVMIENSEIADVKMRIFNRDGSEGKMAGNSIRCVGKYAYDSGMVNRETVTVETASGVKSLRLYTYGGKVGSAEVDMGKAELDPKKLAVDLPGEKIIARPISVGGNEYKMTCVGIGNPHCVVFVERVDGIDLPKIGPLFENHPLFPLRINTEFVRVVNTHTLKMRVWERGNGETMACGTGAAAAAIAAVENGYCAKGTDITVKLAGGDLIVNYTDERVTLYGNAQLICEGSMEY